MIHDNVIRLMPTQLPNKMPVSISPAPAEFGGIFVIIWRDHKRDDGLQYHVADAAEALNLLVMLEEAIKSRAMN
jgi:hypothetical protein